MTASRVMRADTIIRNLKKYTVDPAGCWQWSGYIVPETGYGRMTDSIFAHRFFYQQHVGTIPEGSQIDHLCRVRSCVNPDHLEAVTPRVNTLRGAGPAAVNSKKTHCIHNHEFTAENTRVRRNGDRWQRECKTCDAARNSGVKAQAAS